MAVSIYGSDGYPLVSSSVNSARSRGMLLAAKSFYIGGAKWRNPYVTDGLIAMWDGEWNAGGGVHDSNATAWKDLSGNCHNLDIVNGIWKSNSMQLPISTRDDDVGAKTTDEILNGTVTIECVARRTITVQNWTGAAFLASKAGHIETRGMVSRNFAVQGIAYSYPQTNAVFSCYIGSTNNSNVHSMSYSSWLGLSYGNKDQGITRVYCDGLYKGESGSASSFTKTGFSILQAFVVSGYEGKRNFTPEVYSARVYSGDFSLERYLYNFSVDKARFGIA